MSVKFSNNATTTLAASISASDTTIAVVDASKLPVLATGDYTYITIDTDTASPTLEILKVTAVSGNTLTVVRGQDGTTASSFAAGTKVELRLTAALLNDIAVVDPSGEPIGHTDKAQSSISFNNATRTFTIAPTATSFEVWCKGVKYEYSTAQTVVIPNTTGLHFIYFNAFGVLSTQMSYFTWEEHAPTAYVYWNATTGTAIYFGDERHGITLDWQTHEYLHRTRGAAIANGFAASGYTTTGLGATDADAQIDIGGGTFFDEDMQVDIVSTNSPVANTWQQDLSGPARIPVLYLSGSAWVIDTPTNFPFKVVGGIPQYNLYSGGTWSTASVNNNEYFVSWILATNNLNYPVLSIISQAPTNQLSQAEAMTFEGLSLSGFPSVEFRPLYKVIYTHKTGFTNSVKASTVAVYDLRSLQSAGVAAALVQDHGNLSGLGDDDHAQYLHVSEVRSPSAAVKNSFLPSQTSNSGKYLSTDGTNPVWEPIPSGSLSFTGDVTGSGNTGSSVSLTLANSGVVAGQYTKVTVDAKGRVIAGASLANSDITTALGYTPYNSTNPSGYITSSASITGNAATATALQTGRTISLTGDVTGTSGAFDGSANLSFSATLANSGVSAGTYTKVTVDAKGRVTSGASLASGDLPTYTGTLTSSQITTGLGYTPYNATNPSGYITSSALSSYLPLSGGTMTGIITTVSSGTAINFSGQSDSFGYNATTNLGTYIKGTSSTYLYGGGEFYDGTASRQLLHSGNYSNYTVARAGGTFVGRVVFPSGVFDRPQLPGGILGLDTGDGNFDIWGISRDYYPSHGTAANAWGIRWDGDSNQVRFIGSGTTRLAVDLDGGASGLTWESNAVFHAGNYTSNLYNIVYGDRYNADSYYDTGAFGRSGITVDQAFQQRSGFYDTWASGGTNAISGFSHNTGFVSMHYWNGSTGYGVQIGGNHENRSTLRFRWRSANGINPWYDLLHSGNYNSYAPTLTGGGASGTWGISISGNAATATSATDSTKLPLSGGTLTGHLNLQQPYKVGFANGQYIQDNGNGGLAIYSGAALNFTGTSITASGQVTITPTLAWNNATPALNVGGTGDARLQVRHIWGKSSASAGTDHLWLQYDNPGNHVQIGASTSGNNLYVGGSIYTNGYFTGNLVLNASNYSSYALPLSGGTVSGVLTLTSSSDAQLNLNGNGTTWAGIQWTDSGGNDFSWFYGATGTWAFGGGGSAVSGKKMHVHGGMTIGAGYPGTGNPTNGLNVEGAIQQAGNQVLHAGNYTNYTNPAGNLPYVNSEYNATISSNGWYTIAEYGSGRAQATFHIFDQDSSRHNYVRVNVVWSYGNGGAYVVSAGRHGSSTIRHVRLLYNTSDQTYGGVKVQVYCENADWGNWVLRVRQETLGISGWGAFSQVTPTLANSVSSFAEHSRASNVNDNGWLSVPSGLYIGGNITLHAGNYNSYSPTLTGGNASGTWSINITGNAASISGQANSATITASTGVNGSHIVQRDGNGYIYANHVNFNTGVENPTIANFITDNGDGWSRKSSLAHVKNQIRGVADGTWGINITGSAGSASSATTAGSVSGLTLTSSSNGINPDSVTQNQIGYNTSVSLFGQSDGGLYSSAYSSAWIHQIYGDFRTGQIAIRGKNSGSWQSWRTVLDSGNYTSYSPSLTGSGASGTWGISITGSANTVTNLNGAIQILSGGGGATFGSNHYSIGKDIANGGWSHPHYSDLIIGYHTGIRIGAAYSGIRFYNNSPTTDANNDGNGDQGESLLMTIGGYATGGSVNIVNDCYAYGYRGHSNVAGTGQASYHPAGIYSVGTNWLYGTINMNGNSIQDCSRMNGPWTSSARCYSNEWIEMPNHSGLYSPLNGAHFYPNNASYGPWRIAGSRNGWNGIEFDASNGQVCLMIQPNSNTSGVHNTSYGWHWQWSGGTMYCFKNSYGGGTQATVLDSSNYTSYSPSLTGSGASGSWNITAARATRANGNFYIDDNYGCGIVGVYSSYRYQGVFAMGDAYKLAQDGTTTGSLYGMAWSHPNAGGAAGNLTDHGLLIINNGGFRCAISNSIVASGNITAYSDERLKRNWRDMPENFVERLAQVKVGRYERIDDGVEQVGVSAQSLQPLLPEAIQVAKDEIGTLSVSYGNAAMASAVELAKELVMLKKELAEIKSRLH
jgi:hypothetical protein